MITPQDKAHAEAFVDTHDLGQPDALVSPHEKQLAAELAEYKVRLAAALEANRRLRAVLSDIRQETLKGLAL